VVETSSARTTIDNWIFAVSNPIYFVLNTKTCLAWLGTENVLYR